MLKIASWTKLILFVLVSQAAGLLGTIFTSSAIPDWYSKLNRPSFSPPNWLFGPVWTLLYTLMGLAAYLVYERLGKNPNARPALYLFFAQLFFNAVWTPVFFGAKDLQAAFYIIVLLWFLILLTIVWFFRVRKISGYLMIPYLAWVTFASALNYSLWQLN